MYYILLSFTKTDDKCRYYNTQTNGFSTIEHATGFKNMKLAELIVSAMAMSTAVQMEVVFIKEGTK